MKHIIEKIKEQIEADIYPGASLALFNNEWQEYYFGTQDERRAVTQGLIYDLASVSKVVGVGTVCIFLINKGIIELDSPLKVYYPDFHDVSVTLRQLLTHSSGIDPYIPNRDNLSDQELKAAINNIKVGSDRSFKYTDINFLLLGFMLEVIFNQSLDRILKEQIFNPFGMLETCFGPVENAVPTVQGVTAGTVHDPKARLLRHHAGSAGLFSTVTDLEIFCQRYLKDDFSSQLTENYSRSNKARSLAWDLDGDWLLHTGYTGTFILVNILQQKAAIFLSNRTYKKDDRAQWIVDRDELIKVIEESLLEEQT
ncbi:serine hydrolase domain-containing protein [Streptococcus dentapri]|uniref:Serine hydrolase domain-containing protein n=1 Tax=Streptococcus dentapri TaxID=573564 RepID=A0ABV8D0B7_9STRE